MPVIQNNGNVADHAVGMVAVSSWQGWLYHSPRPSQYEQPGFGSSNLYRFWSTFTLSSPKSAFGYTKNGHMALVAREGGLLTQVVGFNPNSFLYAGILQMIQGNNINVQGLWYDDTSMIHDPTAISYEINVSQNQAQTFGAHIAALIGRSDLGTNSPQGTQYYYSFRPAVTEPATDGIVGNCSNMGLLILCQFLQEWGKHEYVAKFIEWVNTNQNTRNFGQGPLMGAITEGFQ
jgi:hypothetical protein